ncbi:MAG TPA: hypothetical protein VN982_14210 [Candidatus Dormibacteraeota bacterium]|nr:hypothetical protein [Candidatus Dormibacteraeota bacterium]
MNHSAVVQFEVAEVGELLSSVDRGNLGIGWCALALARNTDK